MREAVTLVICLTIKCLTQLTYEFILSPGFEGTVHHSWKGRQEGEAAESTGGKQRQTPYP